MILHSREEVEHSIPIRFSTLELVTQMDGWVVMWKVDQKVGRNDIDINVAKGHQLKSEVYFTELSWSTRPIVAVNTLK